MRLPEKIEALPQAKKVKIRNHLFVPHMGKEGIFICTLPIPRTADKGPNWRTGLKPFERLFYHQTLASVRQSSRFVTTPLVPRDSLDFQLQARYRHSRDSFALKTDFVQQVESCMKHGDTFRVLRNTDTITIDPPLPNGHPLKIGGLKQKISPHSLKLMCDGPHNTQFVNNGYSRQSSDGTFFRY